MTQQKLPTDSRRFWRNHLVWPALVFSVVFGVIELTHLDLLLADWIYAMEGGSWSLRRDYILSDILHSGGRDAMVILLLLVILGALLSLWLDRLKPYRQALWYLAAALPLTPLQVWLIKQISHIDCPWDLLRYGGRNPYISLFQSHPGTFEYGQCFPGSHASAGYTLVALYFFFLHVRPEWRYWGLGAGLLIGLVFDIDQQLRGAHFLSHGMTSLALAWLGALLLYSVWLRRYPVKASSNPITKG